MFGHFSTLCNKGLMTFATEFFEKESTAVLIIVNNFKIL